jgi:DNA polymerase-3 subunit chi
MSAARFYHLMRMDPRGVVQTLAGRALAAGWRVALRVPAGDRADWWDAALWLGPEDGFLPHGVAGGPHDADQPVLILTGAAPPPNGARYLMAVEGALVDPGEVAAYARVSVLFDGHDPAAVEAARGQWRRLTGAGIAAQYWAEDGGRWVKRAEAGGGAKP